MTLQQRLTALAQSIGADIKSLNARVSGPTYVTDLTRQGILNAYNSAPPGGRIDLAPNSTFNFDTGGRNPIVIQKPITIMGHGSTLDGGTSNGSMFKINSCSNVTLQGFSLLSSKVTGDQFESLILVNEEGVVSYLTLKDLNFSCPQGDFNAYSLYCWSGVTNTGVDHNNHDYINLKFKDCGKMAMELLNDSFSGVYRGRDFRFIDIKGTNLGINNEHGQLISLSGEMQNVTIENPYAVDFRNYGLEFVATKNVTVINPFLKSSKVGSNGMNFTDGGKTEGSGNPGHNPKDIDVTGGFIDVKGIPAQGFYFGSLNFTGGTWKGGAKPLFQHGTKVKFDGTKVFVSSSTGEAQNCISFEDVQGGELYDVTLDRSGSTQGPYYQPVNLSNNSSGFIIASLNIKVGANAAQNYNSTFPDHNNQYISGDSVNQNNRWTGVFLEGNKMPDRLGGAYVQTVTGNDIVRNSNPPAMLLITATATVTFESGALMRNSIAVKFTGATGSTTLTPASGQTINGQSTYTLTPSNNTVILQFDNVSNFIVYGNSPVITEVADSGSLPTSTATPMLYYVTDGDLYLQKGTTRFIIPLLP